MSGAGQLLKFVHYFFRLKLWHIHLLKIRSTCFFLLLLACSLLNISQAAGQSSTPEEKYNQARDLAFEQKKYEAAIMLMEEAVQQTPQNMDFMVFLGRLYYWNGQAADALTVLRQAFQDRPDYEDAALALADITYYEKDFNQSLSYSSQGLQQHPTSSPLMLRKAKALAALSQFSQAYEIADSLLTIDPKNEQLRVLAEQLIDYSTRNRISVLYDYTYFDKRFTGPWHIATLEYNRQTDRGVVTARVGYANRYDQNGFQVEIEAYPRISNIFYVYTNLGFSPDFPVFPKMRAGLSLYANLPRSFEVEAGARYLNFDNSTLIFTASLGKYYQKFWFNARSYLGPLDNQISHSYAFTTRYYIKGADNYFNFSIGQGVTPDDREAVLLNNAVRLHTFRVGTEYHFTVQKLNIFSISGRYENVEFRPDTRGNQLSLAVGYQRRF